MQTGILNPKQEPTFLPASKKHLLSVATILGCLSPCLSHKNCLFVFSPLTLSVFSIEQFHMIAVEHISKNRSLSFADKWVDYMN